MSEPHRDREALTGFLWFAAGVIVLTPVLRWIKGDTWANAAWFAGIYLSLSLVLAVYRYVRPRKTRRPIGEVDGGMLGWRTSDD